MDCDRSLRDSTESDDVLLRIVARGRKEKTFAEAVVKGPRSRTVFSMCVHNLRENHEITDLLFSHHITSSSLKPM